MRLGVMADGMVGLSIVAYLIEEFPEDLAVVVVDRANDISELTKSNQIETVLWSDEISVANHIRESSIDLGLMAWWPRKIHTPLLTVPTFGWINTHPSLLPHNRGKHYNFWAIVEQAPFGVSLHFVDEGLDSGDLVAQRDIPVDWTDTGHSLYHKAQHSMLELFRDCYPTLRRGRIIRRAQDLTQGSYHNSSEIDPASEIILDKTYTARELLNLLRARTFQGHPACYFRDDNIRYEVSVSLRRNEE